MIKNLTAVCIRHLFNSRYLAPQNRIKVKAIFSWYIHGVKHWNIGHWHHYYRWTGCVLRNDSVVYRVCISMSLEMRGSVMTLSKDQFDDEFIWRKFRHQLLVNDFRKESHVQFSRWVKKKSESCCAPSSVKEVDPHTLPCFTLRTLAMTPKNGYDVE